MTPGQFAAPTYRMVDCSDFTDYVADFQGSHQYYRRSAGVLSNLASVMV
jgi:hypothetical protein